MYRLIIGISFLALILPNHLRAQEVESILKAPDDWNSELIEFPLSFAPQIDFEGIEDIRFSPGWSNPYSEQFWTYYFCWYVAGETELTDDFLERTMNLYFDGLIAVVINNQEDSIRVEEVGQTSSTFSRAQEGFEGEISIFDAFFTMEEVRLRVKVRQDICKAQGMQLISFELSPKDFETPVWDLFKEIERLVPCN